MTIQEIADLAGVSIATVSRAFKQNSDINPQTRKRVLAIASENGYRPKEYRRQSRIIRKQLTVGVILDCGSRHPLAAQALDGICDVMNQEGIMVLAANSQDDPKININCLDRLREIVQGLIVVPTTAHNDYHIKFLEEINRTIPVVTLTHRNSGALDNVRFDNYSPTYHAISLLIERGHRHIAFITGPMRINPSKDKLSAYTEALHIHGIPIRSEYICYGDFNEEVICGLTKSLLRRCPEITALVTSNVTISRGCLAALDELGMRIPDDIAFVSYGKDSCFSLKAMGITSITDPQFLIGQQAAQLLLRRMKSRNRGKKTNPESIVISPELVIRGSEIFPSNRIAERAIIL